MKFEGVGVALITPFKKDLSIDYAALEQIIDNTIAGGVDYLVVLGTTGETPTLTTKEKRELLTFSLKHNAGRVPVVVGIGGNDTQTLVNQLRIDKLDGVSGILSVVPYYNKPNQEGLYQHFTSIAQATQLPIILYNVPGRTSSNLKTETVLRLAQSNSNIVAIKEASGDIVQGMDMVRTLPSNFAVLSGDDNLFLAQAAIGFKGIISVTANALPREFCKMAHKALEQNILAAQEWHYKLLDTINLLFTEGNPTGIKCLMSLQEKCQDILRLPLVKASDSLRQRIKESFESIQKVSASQ